MPMPYTVTPETLPSSRVSATALLWLNELEKVEVAVLPLFAAVEPKPSASARPRLSRLSPERVLLSMWAELSEL